VAPPGPFRAGHAAARRQILEEHAVSGTWDASIVSAYAVDRGELFVSIRNLSGRPRRPPGTRSMR
jgi:hypothetical protein